MIIQVRHFQGKNHMSKTLRSVIAAIALLPVLTAQAAAPSPQFADLAFLEGSCWEGPFPDGRSTDQHCYKWIQDGRYLRDMHNVIGAQTPYYGETTYYWDHDAKEIRYIYWSNDGGYSVGNVVSGDGAVRFPNERYVGPEGELLVRAEMRKVDNDSYTMRAEMKGKDGTWKEFINSTYRRKPLNW